MDENFNAKAQGRKGAAWAVGIGSGTVRKSDAEVNAGRLAAKWKEKCRVRRLADGAYLRVFVDTTDAVSVEWVRLADQGDVFTRRTAQIVGPGVAMLWGQWVDFEIEAVTEVANG